MSFYPETLFPLMAVLMALALSCVLIYGANHKWFEEKDRTWRGRWFPPFVRNERIARRYAYAASAFLVVATVIFVRGHLPHGSLSNVLFVILFTATGIVLIFGAVLKWSSVVDPPKERQWYYSQAYFRHQYGKTFTICLTYLLGAFFLGSGIAGWCQLLKIQLFRN